jgi:FkbM family methyltransferase
VEPHTLQLFRDHLEPDRDVIDAGAYLGLYALVAARRGTIRRVWAFEPDPRNFACLERNVEENSAEVRCHPLATSDRNGKVSLKLARAGQSRTSVDLRRSEADAGQTRAVTLDDFLPEDAAPGVIKLDVEGHEVAALRGMRQLLEDHRPTLFVEHDPTSLHRQGTSSQALLDFLHRSGYGAEAIDEEGARVVPIAEWSGRGHVNLICRAR